MEVPKLCDYLGPFEVLGGAVVTAYAIVAGELESPAATLLVPKELEPSATDLTFQALAEASGNVLSITSQLQVLPSVSTSFSFSVGQPDAERQSCVLATAYSYQGSLNSKSLTDCTWLPYNGPRKLYLQNLLAEVESIGDLTLNVTVLTTVRRPGYLWSYPLSKTFLWLRERTPLPKVLQILEPGAVAPKAMVWLQEGFSLAECFFTLHYEPLDLNDVPSPFLVEVPSVTASVVTLPEAFRPTAFRSALHGPDTWRSDVELCAWPQICELPMNGTLPAELIAVPAGYTRLCAWSLWQGYLESAPACELMSSTPSILAEPSFAPSEVDVQSLPAPVQTVVLVPEQVGRDSTLRLELLRPRTEPTNATNGRRLSSESMPLFLPRTHPLQYRWASAAIDSSVLMQPGMTQSTLTANMQFSSWMDLGLAADTPLVPLPLRQISDHVLFVVDVRLLTGVNRWSAETRTAALMMLGTEPAASLSHVGRSVVVDTGPGNSSIYFKWLQGDIVSSFGAELVQSQAGAISVATAFALNPEAQLHDSSDTSFCTVTEDSATAQRQFCMAEAPLTLSIPSIGRWTLWTVANSAGLHGSAVTSLMVGQMCQAPMDVAYAMSVSCVEGPLVESGAACTASCQAGYSSSVPQLLCNSGILTPLQFACAEDPCMAPSNVTFASSSCLEGDTMAPGGSCTTQCAAGYTPSISRLSCSRGRLSPSSFICNEAECESPEVIYGASPSCSGLPRVKSRESCSPQCQDGYVASQSLLQCLRGKLEPESFVCEPGVNVDVGIIIASVPSTLLAGSLALVAAYCFRGPKAVEEKEASDPLKEWWQCVKEVEPGICVFCGKQPEELETRYEDHGPATLFRSCHSCAALLGFEVDEEEEQDELAAEELKVEVEDDQESKEPAGSGDAGGNREERNTLPRPAPLMELSLGTLGSRSSRGSISDAVKGLQENFLQEMGDGDKEVPEAQQEPLSERPARPESPRERLETVVEGTHLGETLETRETLHRSEEDSPYRSTQRELDPSRRSQRERMERMSLADWQDSPDERSADLRQVPPVEGTSRRSEARVRRPRTLTVDRTSLADWHDDREPEPRARYSTQETIGPRSRRYEEPRRSRRDGTQERNRHQGRSDSGADELRELRQSRLRSSRRGTSNM